MASLKGKQNPSYKHGFAQKGKRPSVYWRWQHMIVRCHNPKDKDYPRYGGRGITVCDRWRYGEEGLSGFEWWLLDLGPVPFKGASIERVDGTKGYSPDNCCRESTQQQANNKRTNRHVTAWGQTLTIAQWSRIVGIGPKAIRYRLEQGVDPEEALFRKPNHGFKLLTKGTHPVRKESTK